jgi:hypothetical protein
MYNFFNANNMQQMPFQFPDISKMPWPLEIPLIPDPGNAQQGCPLPFQMPQMPQMPQMQQMPMMPMMQQMPMMNPANMYANMMQMWNTMFQWCSMCPFFNMFQMPGMNLNGPDPVNSDSKQEPQGQATAMPFQIQGFDMSKLLQMDMSPDKLNMLQKFLDFAFESYTKEKKSKT